MLDDFTRGYVTCLLWAETDNADEQGGDPLENNYGVEDFDPETLAAIVDDCKQFQANNRADIAQYPTEKHCADGYTYSGAELAGHDYWLTRNGHGAGYWDRDYIPKDVGARLTEKATQAGECFVYVDGGRIYLGV